MSNDNFKQKTVAGLSWSFIDSIADRSISMVVTFVLARLIAPEEFGLLGMITIFVGLSYVFIDSGFGASLIRQKNCTEKDYNTIFYVNLTVSIICYLLIFFSAQFIANFFKEPRLFLIVRVNCLLLIFFALILVQRIIMTKALNFKTMAKISAISSSISGIIAIYLAYKGLGVWTLIWKNIIAALIACFLFWLWGAWRPALIFSLASLKRAFGFGSKLLVSSLINSLFQNIYYPIIGKVFSKETLGFYTKAQTFSDLFSTTLVKNIQNVSYPALATIQDDDVRLKNGYRKVVKMTMLVSLTLILGMAATAKALIFVTIGERWMPCVPYLQLICLAVVLLPLQSANLNILKVKGRSDLHLRIEIIKKSIASLQILVAILWGVEALLIASVINSVIAYLINSYYSADLIGYPVKEQLKDITPSLLFAVFMAAVVWGLTFFQWNAWIMLPVQVSVGAAMFFAYYEKRKPMEYLEVKEIVLGNLQKIKKLTRSGK
jgi:O-antigen/teichoic acid export membrane protein